MKILGRSSVSSFFKKTITFIFYLEFLLILTLPLVFLDDDGIRYSWPITLTSISSQPKVTSSTNKITGFAFNERHQLPEKTVEKTLSFEDSSLGRRLLQTLHNIITISIILLVTFWLKKLFTNLANNTPFTNENSNRVRWIAWSVLFLSVFDVIESFLSKLYTTSTLKLSGASFDFYDNSFDIRTFLLGLLLLIIAELFKRGNEYRADSESIV